MPWTLTCVYGPQSDTDKLNFIRSSNYSVRTSFRQEWLLLGDFNLITKAADKSNLNINRRLMGKFCAALDHLQLKELRLNGRRFTWSNEQENHVLTKIDHLFCTDDRDVLFPPAHLQAIPTMCSDHAPLLLRGARSSPSKSSFKFEEFWLKYDDFKDKVSSVWHKPVSAYDPIRRIHIKLSRMAKSLRIWQREKIGDIVMQIAICKEIIGELDVAEEDPVLSTKERMLRRDLKSNYLHKRRLRCASASDSLA